MKQLLFTFLAGLVALFGFTLYNPSSEPQLGGFRPISVPAGGTGAGSFSPLGVLISGTTTTGVFVASSSPSFGYLIATSTSATSTIQYGLKVLSGNIQISTLTSCNDTSVLETDSSGNLQCGADGGGGGTPGGSDGQVQYNNSSAFGGATNLFYDDTNNRVGVGTTTPNWELQVSSTRPSIAISDTAAPADKKHWFLSSQGGNFYLGTALDSPYSTSTRLTITEGSTYKVGIGTTSPYLELSVVGDTVSNSFTATKIAATSTFTTGFVAGNNKAFTVNRGATADSLYVAGNGNVGVGTAIPSALFTLQKSDGEVIRIIDGAGTNYFKISVNSSNNAVDLDAASSAGSINFDINGTAKFSVPNTGNFQMGSVTSGAGLALRDTSPALSFFVDNFSFGATGGKIIGDSIGANYEDAYLLFQTHGRNTGAFTNDMTIKAGRIGIGDTTPDFGLELVASSTTGYLGVSSGFEGNGDLLTLDANGKLGIGTTTPTTILSVSQANATTTIYIDPQTTGKGSCIQMRSPDGAWYMVYVANGGALTTSPGSCQ